MPRVEGLDNDNGLIRGEGDAAHGLEVVEVAVLVVKVEGPVWTFGRLMAVAARVIGVRNERPPSAVA